MRARAAKWAVIAAVCLAAASSPRPLTAQPLHLSGAATPIEAVWLVQSFDFAYRGGSTSYSCSALRERLRTILVALGAHEGLTIRNVVCLDLSEQAYVQVTMASPIEATSENIAALTDYSATDELIARVRNVALPSAADVERFPATWRTISFANDGELRLAPGDCELVQQLRREVLPRMSIRIVRDNLRCSAAFGNIGRPALRVAALVAQP